MIYFTVDAALFAELATERLKLRGADGDFLGDCGQHNTLGLGTGLYIGNILDGEVSNQLLG